MDGRRSQKGLNVMYTINESRGICNTNNYLKYRKLLRQARPLADAIGQVLIDSELTRVKRKYLVIMSWRGEGYTINE